MTRTRRAQRSRHGLLEGGATPPPHYKIWKTLVQRCCNPASRDYASYGGRGVTLCDRWRCFSNFVEDLGPQPASGSGLQRIDPTRGFEPGNVIWSTGRPGKPITYNGKTQSVATWARELGIKEGTIRARLEKGLSVERALSTRVRGRYRPLSGAGCVQPTSLEQKLADLARFSRA